MQPNSPLTRIALLVLISVILGPKGTSDAQILNRLRKRASQEVANLSDVRRLLERDAPLSTTIEDALTEIPFLDAFDPGPPTDMMRLSRTGDGAFVVPPGHFAYEARSFCLKAGETGPRRGKGHLYAPLEGERAFLVRKILRNAYRHPDISRRQVQLLLWAVVSRQHFEYMRPEIKVIAARMLDPEDLLALNGASISNVSEEVVERAVAAMPGPLRSALVAESRMRRLFRDANASYEDFERLAVPPAGGDDDSGRDIPVERWSYHPDGYFVRYLARHYTRTRFEAFVPEPFSVVRDGAGRIGAIRGPRGDALLFPYDAPQGSANRLNAVSLVRGTGETVRAEWTLGDRAWAVVGDAAGTDFPGAAARLARSTVRPGRPAIEADPRAARPRRALARAAGRRAALEPRIRRVRRVRVRGITTGNGKGLFAACPGLYYPPHRTGLQPWHASTFRSYPSCGFGSRRPLAFPVR